MGGGGVAMNAQGPAEQNPCAGAAHRAGHRRAPVDFHLRWLSLDVQTDAAHDHKRPVVADEG